MLLRNLPPIIPPSLRRSGAAHPEAGLTLIESLMAMLLIVITVTLVTPPIFLVTATRVQQRRAEQALSIAQGEIDRIRLLMEQGAEIPNADNPVPSAGNIAIEAVAAPNGTLRARNTLNAATDWYPVDIDSDGDTDFFVQLFRTNDLFADRNNNNTRDNDEPIQGFDLGVRVYQAQAANEPALETVANTANTTTGRGFTRAPMAALYTQTFDTNSENSFTILN